MDDSKGKKLTPKQEAAINLLTIGTTMADTAKVLEIPYSTVRRWVSANEMFREKLKKSRLEQGAALETD